MKENANRASVEQKRDSIWKDVSLALRNSSFLFSVVAACFLGLLYLLLVSEEWQILY